MKFEFVSGVLKGVKMDGYLPKDATPMVRPPRPWPRKD